jgi:hypothetical protein
MPALIPTAFEGRVLWLGRVPHRERAEIETVAIEEMPLGFGGFAGDCHAGETRPSCSRVTGQYPRGTTIRNVRAGQPRVGGGTRADRGGAGLDNLAPEWVGASVVVEGIPDFSHLPPSSRLQGPDGVTLTVDMQNRPCRFPAKTIETAHPGKGKRFKEVAEGLRGVTAWVERVGTLRIGDALRLHVPDQRGWAHLDATRGA